MPWIAICFVLLLAAYKWDGRRWVPGKCELNLAPYLLPPLWQAEMLAAMNDWNAVSNNFQFVANNASSNTVTSNDFGRFNGRIALTNLYPAPNGSVLTNVYITIKQ